VTKVERWYGTHSTARIQPTPLESRLGIGGEALPRPDRDLADVVGEVVALARRARLGRDHLDQAGLERQAVGVVGRPAGSLDWPRPPM
jgi:hypothetical protein